MLFASDRNEKPSFYRTRATGTSGDEFVYQTDLSRLSEAFPTDWSPDGRYAVFHAFPQTRKRGGGIWMLPLDEHRAATELIQGPFTEWIGTFSPDGRWLAYMSDETGIDEIYVQSLSAPERYRISTGGGSQPRWRHDGRELLFLSPDNRLMSTTVNVERGFAHSAPKALFTGCGSRSAAWEYSYDIAADGERILWLCPADDAAAAATIAVNRSSDLAKKE